MIEAFAAFVGGVLAGVVVGRELGWHSGWKAAWELATRNYEALLAEQRGRKR